MPSPSSLYLPSEDRDIIAASGMFDDAWYHERYADVPATVDGATHYLRSSANEKRQPGPRFDGVWYLVANPDVAESGTNPLLHYVLCGMAEGRPMRALNGAPNIVPFETLALRSHVQSAQSIAVVVHAYYADIFDEICALLRHIPGRFHLYVSVPSHAGLRLARRSIARHRVHCQATIKVCQNRGRNFGPFLAEFAGEVASHDLVLHLHTKKSLFTGADQQAWRNHLYRSLVGSTDLVRMTLNQFASDPAMGVIYPSTAPNMPYWAHHWLSNGHLAGGLFERLGMPRPPAQGYLDYPVGGMFWARVEAIRPLLTAGFQYDDFPPESGQTDGTLAHAIERCIVALAQHRGYHLLDIDAERRITHPLRGGRNLEQYEAFTAEQLNDRIAAVDLVSFDIFDTLLLRPSRTPDSVLRYVGHALQLRYPSAADFFRLRKDSENEARAKKAWTGDVDIEEIYACFPVNDAWTQETIRHAHDLELQTEAHIALPRPAGIAALKVARAAGKRVIAISDTYLKRQFIERLLSSIGAGPFDALYISSERQARKDNGALWSLTLEQEQVAPERWLHIGDNEHSDVQLPCDRGIGFFHLMNPGTLFIERGFGVAKSSETARGEEARRWATDLTLGPLVNQIGGNPFLPQRACYPVVLETPWEVGHAVFGPMLFAFTAWIARHPSTRHLEHLYFLAREGYVLRRAYEQVRTYCEDLHLPPSSYLLASRRMVLSAAQGFDFDPDTLLAQGFMKGTVASLLETRIGLRLQEGLGADAMPIVLPRDRQYAREMLKALRTEITQHGQKELEQYLRYCGQTGIAGPLPYGVVDIGYSGTIQKGLQTILRKPLVGFYLATFDKIASVAHGNGYAYGFFDDQCVPSASKAPLVRNALLMESFLTAPQGQFNGFVEAEDGLQPLYKQDRRSAETLAVLGELHEGAFDYCEELLRAYGSSLISAEVDRTAVQEPFGMLARGEIRAPGEVAHALVVDDDFTGMGDLHVGAQLRSHARD